MASSWPNSVQTFSTVSPGDSLNSPSHSGLHNDVSDTVEALQEHAGLVLVKTEAVGSGVSSVTVTGAFSATFVNYRIIWDSWIASATQGIEFELGAGGSHTSGYYGVSTKRAFDTGVVDSAYNNTSPMVVAYGSTVAGRISLSIEVSNPQTSRFTSFMGMSSQERGTVFTGMYNANTVFTSFTLQAQSGTMTGGTIRVYGYNNG